MDFSLHRSGVLSQSKIIHILLLYQFKVKERRGGEWFSHVRSGTWGNLSFL